MKHKKLLGALAGALALLSHTAAAVPTDMAAYTYVETDINQWFNDGSGWFQLNEERKTGTTFVDSAIGYASSAATASANLATGETKVSAALQGTYVGDRALGDAYASAVDFLTFDSNATVRFDLAIDGSLSVAQADDNAFYFSSARFFDVTGITQTFETDGRTLSRDVLVNEVRDAKTWGQFEYLGTNLTPTPEDPAFAFDAYISQVTTGVPLDIDMVLSGVLDVLAGHTYLVLLDSFAAASNRNQIGLTYADFDSTSSFGFTDLGGASFVAASGVFPGATQVSTVPIPATLILLLAGVGLIGFNVSKRVETDANG